MFKETLQKIIKEQGTQPFEDVMRMAVAYYYSHHHVFGAKGDFITAPEISQVFGEVIGAWVIDAWVKMGAPKAIRLVEVGPGKGTLMKDMIRVFKAVPDFMNALHIHMIEQSEALIEQQKILLKDVDNVRAIVWTSSIDSIELDAPMIVIGNEFLDALPTAQYIHKQGAWFHRHVGLSSNGDFLYKDISCEMPRPMQGEGVFEISIPRETFIAEVARLIKRSGGLGLFIDYGHVTSAYGDTVQAVKDHAYADVLETLGEADLTSHVDFDVLQQVVEGQGVQTYPTITQGVFLSRLGAYARAKALGDAGVDRLISPSEMGALFKVFCFSDKLYPLEGFI